MKMNFKRETLPAFAKNKTFPKFVREGFVCGEGIPTTWS
jgi:hypothetical protein